MRNYKKTMTFFLIFILSMTCTACHLNEESLKNVQPKVSQIKAIGELAVMECYYHNVAKFKHEEASGILFWKKDKHFWIEYSGVVTIGLDTSLLKLTVDEDKVYITIPNAKVLDKKVDEASLTKESFFVDVDSAAISAEDETEAFKEAQEKMIETASNDTVLLASAQQRAQKLIEEYVLNIGAAVGKEYSIEWTYIDSDPDQSDQTDSQ